MADNTLVLFTADHGNMLGEKGRWFKGIQYEGSAHVPLLWRGPQGARGSVGRAVSQVVENTDLLPSILETAGLPAPEGVQGKSFVGLTRGPDPKWKNRAYSQLRAGMLVDGDWKLIDNSLDGTGDKELYNLADDPKEDRNLAGDPRQRERGAEYSRLLAQWRAQRPAPVRVAGLATPDYAQAPDEEGAGGRRKQERRRKKD